MGPPWYIGSVCTVGAKGSPEHEFKSWGEGRTLRSPFLEYAASNCTHAEEIPGHILAVSGLGKIGWETETKFRI
ncbi:hypothetical protein E2C01_013010 [Portunus trituberculatus]|uniref:Uncharacterized protein n=1 Tax=Portunus trituberculatus TaxID=210409 RepID=A0A5B7DFI5_PORTR|nr:hypothetical protein [Portunus trituberculatus]